MLLVAEGMPAHDTLHRLACLANLRAAHMLQTAIVSGVQRPKTEGDHHYESSLVRRGGACWGEQLTL